MLHSPPCISPTPLPSSLNPPTVLLLPPPTAGKRSWPAMETAWLRRRPGRCTGDKFVCVSWAATLSGRTLTRSCQWEGKSRPSTSSAHLLPCCTPTSLTPILLSPRLVSPAAQDGTWGRTGPLEPRLSSGVWDCSAGLRDTRTSAVEVPKTHLKPSQNSIKHTMGPQDNFPCFTEKKMDSSVEGFVKDTPKHSGKHHPSC